MVKMHYKKKSAAFTLLILITIFLCSVSNAAGELTENPAEKYGLEDPTVSGPVSEVPWTEDEGFIEALENNPDITLMAAYRTVLHDPLPGEEFNVHLAADKLCGIIVKPGEIFSQNTSIGPYTMERGFQKGPTYSNGELITTIGGGVCKIASTLYNTTVLCNLEVVERHNHTMPVPYVPYGQDATVAYGVKDFRFRNDTGGKLMIWAKGIDNVLYMGFYGQSEAPVITWRHKVLDVKKAGILYKYNNSMAKGEKRVLTEGMDGMRLKSWVTIDYGEQIIEKYMGISDYKPMPWLIEPGHGGGGDL
jgi:vancomycin resistance protein YoaR